MKRLIIQSVRKLQAGEPVTLGESAAGSPSNRDIMQEKLQTMFEPPQPVSNNYINYVQSPFIMTFET